MLKKTVYFRTQDDLDKFNAIGNKAEWLHEKLNPKPVTFGMLKEADSKMKNAPIYEPFKESA